MVLQLTKVSTAVHADEKTSIRYIGLSLFSHGNILLRTKQDFDTEV